MSERWPNADKTDKGCQGIAVYESSVTSPNPAPLIQIANQLENRIPFQVPSRLAAMSFASIEIETKIGDPLLWANRRRDEPAPPATHDTGTAAGFALLFTVIVVGSVVSYFVVKRCLQRRREAKERGRVGGLPRTFTGEQPGSVS